MQDVTEHEGHIKNYLFLRKLMCTITLYYNTLPYSLHAALNIWIVHSRDALARLSVYGAPVIYAYVRAQSFQKLLGSFPLSLFTVQVYNYLSEELSCSDQSYENVFLNLINANYNTRYVELMCKVGITAIWWAAFPLRFLYYRALLINGKLSTC